MRKYIDIVESSILNEYIVALGEPPTAMLHLNLFEDMLYGQLDELGFEKDDLEKYKKIAGNLSKTITDLPAIPLPPDLIDQIENAWYDGSDAYEDPDTLKSIYDHQIQVCENLIEEINLLLKTPDIKKTILSSIINRIKDMNKRSGRLTDFDIKHIRDTIQNLKTHGFDYPEYQTIEKILEK